MSDADPANPRARDDEAGSAASRLFDIRGVIAAVFAVYGLILLVLGLAASDADIDKSAGVNANLWTGVGLLVVAVAFGLWVWRSPVRPAEPDA